MSFRNLRVDLAERIATLTLNRPQRLNALDNETLAELATFLGDIEGRDDVRVLIVTGEGRAFCTGGDVKSQPDRFDWTRDRHLDRMRAIHFGVTRPLATLKIPTLALVNGTAAGGGLGLALACDIRVAALSARFGAGFRKVALALDMGLSYFLPRAVGSAKALEILYGGEWIEAEEALRIGLVNRVVPDDSLKEEGLALARSIATGPPLALRLVKQAIQAGEVSSLDGALDLEADIQARCLSSRDHREGVRAFLERRDPAFTGEG